MEGGPFVRLHFVASQPTKCRLSQINLQLVWHHAAHTISNQTHHCRVPLSTFCRSTVLVEISDHLHRGFMTEPRFAFVDFILHVRDRCHGLWQKRVAKLFIGLLLTSLFLILVVEFDLNVPHLSTRRDDQKKNTDFFGWSRSVKRRRIKCLARKLWQWNSVCLFYIV